MRSKLFKKIVSGIAAASMLAQIAALIPANAATYADQEVDLSKFDAECTYNEESGVSTIGVNERTWSKLDLTPYTQCENEVPTKITVSYKETVKVGTGTRGFVGFYDEDKASYNKASAQDVTGSAVVYGVDQQGKKVFVNGERIADGNFDGNTEEEVELVFDLLNKKVSGSIGSYTISETDMTLADSIDTMGVYGYGDDPFDYKISDMKITVETYYSQDFESYTAGKAPEELAYSKDAPDNIVIKEDNGNKYLSLDFGSTRANSRGAYANFSPDVSDKNFYVIEFDAALKKGDEQETDFAVKTSSFKNQSDNINNEAESGYLFLMRTIKSDTWTINDTSSAAVNLTAEKWYHYKLIVDQESKLTSVMIDGVTVDTDGAAKPKIVGINGSATDVAGVYMRAGRYNAVISIDNIIVRDKYDEDIFGEFEPEILSNLSWESQINQKITQPKEDEPVHIPVTVKALGNYGHDLAEASDIKWTVTGLGNEDGYISLTKEEGTGEGTEGESPDGSATAYFNVRNGVSNWYGMVTAEVTYGGETKTISTPFAVIGASGGGNNIAPEAGYPESMNSYDDDLVGYKGTADDITSQDLVLNNWSCYGSNTQKSFLLKKDNDGTKYLQFNSNGGSGSTVAVYQLADQKSQYIVDMKVRFSDGSTTFGHYYNTPNNGGNFPNWTASFSGNQLTFGTQAISGLSKDNWYRIVVSADESAGTCWAKVYANDGTLAGEIDDVPVTIHTQDYTGSDGKTVKADNTQKYFCFMGAWPVDIASFKIYYPTIAEISVNGDDTVSVPMPDEEKPAPTPIATVVPAELTEYDADAKTLTVNSDDVSQGILVKAEYENDRLLNVKTIPLTFTDGCAVAENFEMTDTARLFVWDDLKTVKPLKAGVKTVYIPVEDTPVQTPDTTGAKIDAQGKKYVEKELSAIVKTAEGFDVTAEVKWSADTSDETVTITPDKENSHKAVLTVKEGAAAGAVTVTAVCGDFRAEKVINLTTTGSAISFSKSVTSLTIPFSGEPAVSGVFEASTVDKDGNTARYAADKDGNATETAAAVAYTVLDKNQNDITSSMPAGITFDASAGTLTVTDQAKANIIYIQAKNNDEIPLSRSIKVNIHGMSFAFGSAAPEDDKYTQVTDDVYTEKTGYGFVSSASVNVEEKDVKGVSDYRFKADVPNGNYAVTVETTSGAVKSEVVESVPAITGISKTDSSFNVAVCDGVLDLTFEKGSALSTLEITQAPKKTANDKPYVYAIGDSTTKNTANGAMSWGNYAENHISELKGDVFSGFANHGMAGRDSVNYYNEARVETVLLGICPGDYVTVNMGINSRETNEAGSYETLISKYYVDGIIQRGGIPVIVTATPDGPVDNALAADYDEATGKFTNNRGNGARNDVLRKIAGEKQINLIELGQAGEDWFNSLTITDVRNYNTETGTEFETVLEMVQSWYVDHNHYKEPLAKWISEYMFNTLKEIAAEPDKYVPAS